MPLKQLNAEVLVAEDDVVAVCRADLERLVSRVPTTPRKRIRICAHRDASDRLHEMLIAMTRDTYIRAHKHLNKSESVHVIAGSADFVLFDDAGQISEIIEVGDYASGRQFYYRVSGPQYHTLLIRSEVLVVHETTNGPFHRDDTRKNACGHTPYTISAM